jgi:tetratricopeptide (TPR) repeat protein
LPFFKDLLRRRVPQVTAVYLGASFGLLEFVDFVTQRFGLSPHLIDLALIVPLLLLPSVILVTYFHGAPGQDEWVPAEKIGVPINIIIAFGFLFFFLQGKDLGAVTETVTVTDESGVASERVVPKAEFRKRVAVFFFDSEEADSAAHWVGYGLPIAVFYDLFQDEFLDLRMPVQFAERLRQAGFDDLDNVPLSLARQISEEQHRDHFVVGSVKSSPGTVEATVALYETQRGRLVEERTYTGPEVLALADEISLALREDLRVPDRGGDGAQDLPVSELLTESESAYRMATEAIIAAQVERDFEKSTGLYEQAIAEDPTYANAHSTLATLYLYTNQPARIVEPMQAAMDHLYRLPERIRFAVQSNYYLLVRQDMEKATASLDMWAELFPDDIQAFQARLQIQNVRDDKNGALESLNRILELDPGQRDILLQIGDLHQAQGNTEAAEEAFRTYADEFPDNHEVLARLADLARESGDFGSAKDLYDRAMILAPSDLNLVLGMAATHVAEGDFDASRRELDAAMAMAQTPDARSGVMAALESFHVTQGQIRRAIEIMEERLAEAEEFTPPILLAQQKLSGAGRYAEVGRASDALAVVEAAGASLASPFDALTAFGEMQVNTVLEDPDAMEATFPAVEAFITTLQYEFLRPNLVAAQGRVHELRGEYEEAIARYEEERVLRPAESRVLTKIARCYRAFGEHGRSLELLQEALVSAPNGPRTNYETALTYEAMGRLGEAREHLSKTLAIWAEADPDFRWAVRAREAAERMGI